MLATSAIRPLRHVLTQRSIYADGFEATRRIRAFERQQNLPPAKILALTGLGSAEAQREALSSGCDLFLNKPVQLKELTGILDELIRERDASDAG